MKPEKDLRFLAELYGCPLLLDVTQTEEPDRFHQLAINKLEQLLRDEREGRKSDTQREMEKLLGVRPSTPAAPGWNKEE